MKKILFLILLLIVTTGSIFAIYNLSSPVENIKDSKGILSAVSLNLGNTPSPEPTKQIHQPGTPVRIQIPAINVDANIEPVGLDDKNRMDVPKNSDNTGWFSPGFKPGEKGNAALAGHLDKITGEPAVFWSLAQLKSGDEIIINDSKNQQYIFTVYQISTYPYNDFPLREVFGESNQSRLNLISCNGNWDVNSQNYSQRIVVYSRMKN